MSRDFREWKHFMKLYHTCGRYREYKPTMYYYKKMKREQQKALKREEASWRQLEQELMK